MRQVLILGADGQLGRELQRYWPDAVALGRAACDLSDLAALRRCVREHAPALILNAAAYTAVDQAEEDRALAMLVNGGAVGVLAEEAARLGTPLVHYSTDYVFDGRHAGALTEDVAPAPLSVYGQSKLAGEEAIRQTASLHLILRTSWVYGGQGRNFVRTILRLAAGQSAIRVVNDQVGSPTWARDLAQATFKACSIAGQGGWAQASGLYHLSADGETSWHGLAREIVAEAVRLGILREPLPDVLPISTADYGARAARPARSVLCMQKFRSRFGFGLPYWRESLARFLAEEAATSGLAPLP